MRSSIRNEMTRLGKSLACFWIGVAAWLSDRWAWTLPALIGVVVGVSLSRLQRQHHNAGKKGLPPFELGSLLILLLFVASFVYLYLTFLVLELGRSLGYSPWVLGLGTVLLSLILVGLGAVFILKRRVPQWLLQVWDWLLAER